MNYTFCAPTLFGLEGIVADELRFHGKLDNVTAENGRVLFEGDDHTLAWANLNLRCAERVLLRLASFPASSFDALFEGVRAIPWEDFLPRDAAFPVKGHSLDSALHSIPDCQKIIKKAIVDRLSRSYHLSWFEETGAKMQVQFSIMHDRAEIFLDTSGAGLHKRGYRANANAAPLRETLAARLKELRPDEGVPAWAFRFIQSLPSVTVTLSGMSAMDQVEDNLRTFSEEKPLSDEEMKTLLAVADSMTGRTSVPCTACRYCTTHCPQGLDIPMLLELYNEHTFTGGGFIAPMRIAQLPQEKKPSACLACRSCEAVCPQQIKISEALADFSAKLGL